MAAVSPIARRASTFPFPGNGDTHAGMHALFQLMARQHGVAATAQARRLGVSRRVERRLLAHGVIDQPCPGVLTVAGAPLSFEGRAMAAALSRGVVAISHGAAARLHRLDAFGDHDAVDVLGVQGAHPHQRLGVRVHRTRGDTAGHVTTVGGIPVLTVAATLALLAPEVGIGPTARALDDALRRGVSPDELRATATAWRRRGRSGPPALLMLLGERVDHRLPRSWFQHLAATVSARTGVRLVGEHPVRDAGGILLAQLDLADPARRVGVEAQRWQWHATSTAERRDAQRRGALRQLGWEVVDVWWSDLHQPDRVVSELAYLLGSRRPGRPARTAR
jgi:hypothetical protein